MATPSIEGGHIYCPCSYGQFRCLKLETGLLEEEVWGAVETKRLWETFAPTSGKSQRWGHAFVVKQGDRAFLFNEQGDLSSFRLNLRPHNGVERHSLRGTQPERGRLESAAIRRDQPRAPARPRQPRSAAAAGVVTPGG